VAALQITALVVVVAFLAYSLRHSWHEASPRLRHARLVDIALSLAFLTLYYLAFVVGWMVILRGLGLRIGYREALRAEMLSLLAKYVPGGVWTPAARVVAARRAGITDGSLVLASVALEAGLSAVAGALVFALSLPFFNGVQITAWPVFVFAAAVVVLMHPRLFRPLALRLLRPFGAQDVPALSYARSLVLVAYYCVTWLIGGVALWFIVKAVGNPSATAIPFLGGAAAVGAIVAVLAFFTPSGLGAREGAMYGLLVAVVPPGAALGAVVLNRLAITVVEAGLLAVATPRVRGAPPEPAPSEQPE
jgi:uncharacterized membrane protein YbhN (UPF0104 family)